MLRVIKRNGTLEDFNIDKIKAAIKAAFVSYKDYDDKTPYINIDDKIIDNIANDIPIWDKIPIEIIQDEIIEVLTNYDYPEIAKNYTIYRYTHKRARDFVAKKKKFIEQYKNSRNTADATIDDNSNVGGKNIGILNAEGHKEENILVSRGMITDKLRELYPDFDHKQYIKDLMSHIIYKHDESSFMGPIAPYCVSASMYPFLLRGIKELGGLSAKPENLDSFCGIIIREIFPNP